MTAANLLWIDGYLDHLAGQRQLALLTRSAYRRDLLELLSLACASDHAASLAKIGHFNIRKFAATLHGRGLNPRSIARKLSAWRGFFGWLAQTGVIAANPVDGIKPPKRSKTLPKALAADDAVRVVTEAGQHATSHPAREACNRAMFELLYSSGLRVSELTGLDVRYAKEPLHTSVGWIDFDAHEVTVTGKGSKTRTVPVGQAAMDALKTWLPLRATLVKLDPYPLFLNERGTRLSARTLQLRLKAHAQSIGLPVDVHPHVLRHSFASHVLQSSGDLRAVQEMLGHASISATQIYTSLDFQRLAQVYDAAHPRARKKQP